jgi:hypothetical protein
MFFLAGCAGTTLYRGVENSHGAFVSSASPVVSVLPAEDFRFVTSGHTWCRVPVEDSFMDMINTEVWYSLAEQEHSQIVTLFAECPADWMWEVRTIGVDYQKLKILYESSGTYPQDANVHVFVRSPKMDPWLPLFSAEGSNDDILVARYEWTGGTDRSKLIVEYREPAPKYVEGTMIPSRTVESFLARAQKSFVLGGVQMPVQLKDASRRIISDAVLAPVIGAVYRPERYFSF